MAVLRRMVPSRLLAAAQAAGSLRPAGHLTYGHRSTSYASSTLAIAMNSDSCGGPKAQRSTASAAARSGCDPLEQPCTNVPFAICNCEIAAIQYLLRVKNGSEINALSPSQVPPKPTDRRTKMKRCPLSPQLCAWIPPFTSGARVPGSAVAGGAGVTCLLHKCYY